VLRVVFMSFLLVGIGRSFVRRSAPLTMKSWRKFPVPWTSITASLFFRRRL
jgi:hypothetical protein